MSLLAQIRSLVSEFMSGSIEAKDLADRLELLLEAAESASDSDALSLANQVELRIARFVDGYISEVSLRVQLYGLVPPSSTAPIVSVEQVSILSEDESVNSHSPFSASGALSPAFGVETPANIDMTLVQI